MLDAVIISDIHLGSEVCRAKDLIDFLDRIDASEIATRRLILNGDVFDSWDFRRLKKSHWKVLSRLRRMSDSLPIVWINGNHDGPAEIVSHLLGVDVVEEYGFESGSKRVLAFHGDRFDSFLAKYPIVTSIADFFYQILQKLDKSHHVARYAKKSTKIYLRNSAVIEAGAIAHARAGGYDVVCCGHTHFAVSRPGAVGYYNSGCWTERPCTYLTVSDGEVAVRSFDAELMPEVSESLERANSQAD